MNDSFDESMKDHKSALASQNRIRRGQKASPDAAFDVWLDHGLREMFGDVEKEPIPADLLALINKDREKG